MEHLTNLGMNHSENSRKDPESVDNVEIRKLVEGALGNMKNVEVHDLMEALVDESFKLKQKIDKTNIKMARTIPLMDKTLSEIIPFISDTNENRINCFSSNISNGSYKKPTNFNEMNALLADIQPMFAEFIRLIQIPSQLSTEMNKLMHAKKCILKAKILLVYRFFSFTLNNGSNPEEATTKPKEHDEHDEEVMETEVMDGEVEDIKNIDDEQLPSDPVPSDHEIESHDTARFCKAPTKADNNGSSPKITEHGSSPQSTATRVLKLLLRSEYFSNKGFIVPDAAMYLNTLQYDIFRMAKLQTPFNNITFDKKVIKVIAKPSPQSNMINIFSGSQRRDAADDTGPTARPPEPSTDRNSLVPVRSSYSPLWFTSMNRLALIGVSTSQRPINHTFNQSLQSFRNSAFSKPTTRFKLKHNQSKMNKKCLIPKGQKNSDGNDLKLNLEHSCKNDPLNLLPIDASKKQADEAAERKWQVMQRVCSLPCRFVLVNQNDLNASSEEDTSQNIIVPYNSFKWAIMLTKPPIKKASVKHRKILKAKTVSKATKCTKKVSVSDDGSSFCTGSSDSLFRNELGTFKLNNAPSKKPAKSEKKKKKEVKATKGQTRETSKYRAVEIEINDPHELRVEMPEKGSQQVENPFQLQIATCQPPPAVYRISKISSAKQRRKHQLKNV